MVRVKLLGKDSKRRRSDRPLASTSIYGSNKEDKKKKIWSFVWWCKYISHL